MGGVLDASYRIYLKAERWSVRGLAVVEAADIGAARLVLERAVEMGSAQANFALAETYDPSILAK